MSRNVDEHTTKRYNKKQTDKQTDRTRKRESDSTTADLCKCSRCNFLLCLLLVFNSLSLLCHTSLFLLTMSTILLLPPLCLHKFRMSHLDKTFYSTLVTVYSHKQLTCSNSRCLCLSAANSSSSITSSKACSIVLPTRTSRIGFTSMSKSNNYTWLGISFVHRWLHTNVRNFDGQI